MTRQRLVRYVVAAVLLAGVAVQFVPVARTNALGTGDPQAPRDVMWTLRRACYDCHSEETRWPIWAYVAPISWRVVDDVKRARRVVNFSNWATHNERNQAILRQLVHTSTASHRMPMWYYITLHPDARLSVGEIEGLRRWADTTTAGR